MDRHPDFVEAIEERANWSKTAQKWVLVSRRLSVKTDAILSRYSHR